MFCSISGHTPVNPVISRKSGHIFERRLLEQHLEEHDGACPVTGEALSLTDDVIDVKTPRAVNPRPVDAMGIPGMLGLFQNEWDSLMSESFTLKKHLHEVRQELSQALYQHDAACRVIARVLKERDDLQAVVTGLRAQVAAAATNASVGTNQSNEASAMDVDGSGGLTSGLSDNVIQTIKSTCSELSNIRKDRKNNRSSLLPDKSQMSGMNLQKAKTLHKTNPAGISCLYAHHSNLVLTGGIDGEIKVSSRTGGKVLSTLRGHSKRINQIICHPTEDLIFSCSADETIKMWRPTANSSPKKPTKSYEEFFSENVGANVLGISLHPNGLYLASCLANGSWLLHDIQQQTCILTNESLNKTGLSGISFHPDGALLGVGTTDGDVCIFDMKTQVIGGNAGCVATLKVPENEGAKMTITCLNFSENGYHMCAGRSNGYCHLFDLRKLAVTGSNGMLGAMATKSYMANDSKSINQVAFDDSGLYLAIADDEVSVYLVKKWTKLCQLQDHKKKVTGVQWNNKDSTELCTSSMDRKLNYYSVEI